MEGERFDVIVIGGGAAGMMAAAAAAGRGRRTLLLEKNRLLGEKLSITGGGRCNIANGEPDERALLAHFGPAAPSLYAPLARFGLADTIAFFESIGVPTVTQARGRMFPASERAPDVTAALYACLKERGVTVRTGLPVARIEAGEGGVRGVLHAGKELRAESYVLATGGVSHPETGSTGDGFRWLRDLGHEVRDPTPTIVPLRTKEAWSKGLAGTTLKDAKVSVLVDGARRFSVRGDLLLTHFGVSGPTILNAAGRIADLLYEGTVTLSVDLFPGEDLGILDRRIAAGFDTQKNKEVRNAFREIAPPGTADGILTLVPAVDPATRVHSVTKEQRRALAEALKALPLTVSGLMGMDRAVVADGCVALDEVDTRTMRSKKVQNLFVTGDLLDIRRPTGGYSLQLCWTTGAVAGMHA